MHKEGPRHPADMLARDIFPSRLTSKRVSRPVTRAASPAFRDYATRVQWSDSCFSESLHGLPLHGSLRCLHSHVCTCLVDPSSWMPSSLAEEEASLTSFLDEVAEEEGSFSSGAGEGVTEPPFWSCFLSFSAARASSFCAF